jgi:hypothetical protein
MLFASKIDQTIGNSWNDTANFLEVYVGNQERFKFSPFNFCESVIRGSWNPEPQILDPKGISDLPFQPMECL